MRVELAREDVSLVGFTRELSPERALVITDTRLVSGTVWHARLSLRGLVAPVELSVEVASSHALVVAPGAPPTHQVELILQPGDSGEREALAALCARALGPRVEDLGYLRVLVVDDNEMTRDMYAYGVRKYFRQHNCDVEVESVADGEAAWERLHLDVYDLILVDHYMPIMMGAELTALIRREPHLAAMPIVAVSGGGEFARSECLAAGADVFLPKPLVFRDLLETLGGLAAGPAAA